MDRTNQGHRDCEAGGNARRLGNPVEQRGDCEAGSARRPGDPAARWKSGRIARGAALPDAAVRAIRARHYGAERAAPGLLARAFGVSHQKITAVLQPRQACTALTADAALPPAPVPSRGEGGGPPSARALPNHPGRTDAANPQESI